MAAFYILDWATDGRLQTTYGDFQQAFLGSRNTSFGKCLDWLFRATKWAMIVEFIVFVFVVFPLFALAVVVTGIMLVWPALPYLWPLLLPVLAAAFLYAGMEVIRVVIKKVRAGR
jgi:hypothetical protein